MYKSLLSTLIAFLTGCFVANAQSLDSTMWVTNGIVHAIARDSNTIYLAGSFDYVYANTGGGATINLSDGKLSNPGRYPHINGIVRTSVPDGKGGWYIGGNFTRVQGIERLGVAHILADNSLDLFWNVKIEPSYNDGNLDGGIYCMVLSGNTLYLGGSFSKVGGYVRNYLAALEASTGRVTNWAPQVASYTYMFVIRSLAVSGQVVYVGGNFHSISGAARSNIAAVDATRGDVLPWNPTADNEVWSLLATENTVYAGGQFNKIGGQNRNYLAALDAVSGGATPWAPWVGVASFSDRYRLHVSAMALHDNLLYVGGDLSTDAESNTIRALDVVSGQTKWYKKVNNILFKLEVVNNTLYVGGNFTKIDYATLHSDGYEKEGLPRSGLASIDLATDQVTAWHPSSSSVIFCMSIEGDKMYVGGSGLQVNRQSRKGIAAFNALTGEVTDWVPEVNIRGGIRTLAVTGSDVWVGGKFDSPDARQVKNLVAFDKRTGQLRPWNTATDSTVSTMAVDRENVFLGGFFTKVGGAARSRLAAVNATTGQVTAWAPVVNGGVFTIALRDGLVYAGGQFTQVNGQERNCLAGIKVADGQPTAWNPAIEKTHYNSVSSVAILRNTIYILGLFYKVGTRERRHLAAIDLNTGQATNWNPNGDNLAVSDEFNTLAAFNNTVYVGGNTFWLRSGQVRGGLAGLDAISGKITWQPDFEVDFSDIYVIATYTGAVYVGGDFTWFGQLYYPRSARFQPNFAAFGEKVSALPNYITGNIFREENNDCVKNATEKGMRDVVVVAEPGPYYGLSDSLGNYSIAVDTGTYTVRQVLPPDRTVLIGQRCPSPAAHTVSFKTYNNTAGGKDFGNQVTLQPYLAASVTSTRRRRCFDANTTISYCNEGSLSASDVKVHLALPEYVVLVSANVPYTLDKNKHYVFTVGNLPAGQCGTIQIRDSVACNNPDIRGLTQCTRVWITPANPTVPGPGWDQSDVTLKAKCLTNGRVRLGLYNTGTGAMTDSSAYRVYLDAGLALSRKFKLAAGDSLLLQVPANGQTVRLEADQRPGHPTKQSTSVSIEGCGTNADGKVSLGFVAQLPADDAEPEVDVECLPITDSYDPNDKLVLPAGLSGQHLTAFGQELEYTVRFQNTGNDYAYQVVLTDTLSEMLDISTLRVAGASHPYKFTVSGKGRPVLTWTFDNINLPDSTRDGVGSNGFARFTVRPLDNLPTGTRIENFADIFFDYNPPVRTNTVFNTLGVLPTEAPGGDAVAITVCRPNVPVSAGPDRFFCDQDSVKLQARSPHYGQGRWKRISGPGTVGEAANPYSTVTGWAWVPTFSSGAFRTAIALPIRCVPGSPLPATQVPKNRPLPTWVPLNSGRVPRDCITGGTTTASCCPTTRGAFRPPGAATTR
jgi:uncharacterized repeat protein (TIGR01451 family)